MLRAMTVVVHAATKEQARAEADHVAAQAFEGRRVICRGAEETLHETEDVPNPLFGHVMENGGRDPRQFLTVPKTWQGGYLYASEDVA